MLPIDKPIAVVAPSGVYKLDRFNQGLSCIQDHGFKLKVPEDILQPVRYLAGTDAHRSKQLLEALTNDDYGAVWIARGGYGIARILDSLPWSSLPQRPIIGFSDVTALLIPLWQRNRTIGIHAPVVHSLPVTHESAIIHLFKLLNGSPTAPLAGEQWIAGETQGTLTGGNLCMLTTLCGTPYQLDARDSVLVLEEIAEPPYKVDRMLQQLQQSGCLEGLRGVAIGEFLNCSPPESAGWRLRDIIVEHFSPYGVPIIGNLPIGHGAMNFAFPIGVTGQLKDSNLSWEAP